VKGLYELGIKNGNRDCTKGPNTIIDLAQIAGFFAKSALLIVYASSDVFGIYSVYHFSLNDEAQVICWAEFEIDVFT
jgi:hypothetical protein